jgi:hypothetical protein
MTNKKILLKILEKAKRNGYQDIEDYYEVIISQDEFYNEDRFIFNHDFAKAFWGEECGLVYNKYFWKCKFYLCAWKYHLMVMVLEKNPIKYLEKFL